MLTMLNLNMVIPGAEHIMGTHSCTCYTEHGKCSSSHLCDCCEEKLAHLEEVSDHEMCQVNDQEGHSQTAAKEEGSCHQVASEEVPQENKSKMSGRIPKDGAVICRLGCSKSQNALLLPSVVDPYILTERPNLKPNTPFSIRRASSLRKPLTPFINPPEKPPKFIA